MRPRVSVLIPTLEAERHLERLLPALAAQRVAGGLELRVLDSGSSDRTRELALAAGAQVETIARAAFRHGPARNRLAAGALGDVLVFLSQDALPEGEDFVARLAAALDDPRTAAAYARLLPREDDDPLTARTVLAAPEARAEPRLHESDDAALAFHDIASAIRADALRALPFPDVAFGEDLAWARAALDRGWRIRYAADAVARHAHRYGLRSAFERWRVDAAFHRTQTGRRVRPSVWSVARGLGHELAADVAFLARRRALVSTHLVRAPFLRGAQVIGQYFGSRGWNPGSGVAATRRLR